MIISINKAVIENTLVDYSTNGQELAHGIVLPESSVQMHQPALWAS